MKPKLAIALSGLTALISAADAQAAFTGIQVEWSDSFFSNHPDLDVRNAWNAGPANQLDVHRVYATFNSNTPADRVSVVYGIAQSPLSIQPFTGQLYNYTESYGGETQHFNIPNHVEGAPPARFWDTWATIGQAVNSTTMFTPDLDQAVNNFQSPFSTTNAAWFVIPDDPIGQAVSSAPSQATAPAGQFRVLLMQITVTQGSSGMMSFGAQINLQQLPNLTAVWIPSPAGLGLIGIAFATGHRRRRLA